MRQLLAFKTIEMNGNFVLDTLITPTEYYLLRALAWGSNPYLVKSVDQVNAALTDIGAGDHAFSRPHDITDLVTRQLNPLFQKLKLHLRIINERGVGYKLGFE